MAAGRYSAITRYCSTTRAGATICCFTSISTATRARVWAPAIRPVGRRWSPTCDSLLSMAIPRFADLPVVPDAPPHSSWGVFGRDDQRGTLNFLTDQRRLEAARLIRRGRTFSLDLPLNLPYPPMFASRTALRHTVLHRPGTFGRDDVL